MYWYKVDITEEDMMRGQVGDIQEQFAKLLILPNVWRVTALYSQRHEKDHGETVYLYCESEVHAKHFAALFSMLSCNPPSLPLKDDLFAARKLILLAGDTNLDERIRSALKEDESLG